MADTTIAGLPTKAAPLDYLIPKSIELLPRSIRATFDGTGAGAAFLPTLQVIADSGQIVGSYPVATAVAAGASADVSWFPGLGRASATAVASSIVGATVAQDTGQTIPGATNAALSWDTLMHDTSGGTLFSAGTPTLLLAPDAGIYLLTVELRYAKVAGTTLGVGGDENTAQFIDIEVFEPPGVTAGATVALTFAHVLTMQASDSIAIHAITTGPSAVKLDDSDSSISFPNFATWTHLA